MTLFDFLRRDPVAENARSLYRAAVEQARRPEFYLGCGVADTVTGRFEMITLHVFLLLHRLKGERERAAGLAQALFDAMFADMDETLRELGASDVSVGRRIQEVVEGFYGRLAAYDAALRADAAASREGRLAEALLRNLYAAGDPAQGTAASAPGPSHERCPAHAGAMADYVHREAASLQGQDLDELLAGRASFGPPPPAP